jgi:NAD(P)H-hydrate repair Nnr-like enzyme with NAD(P)H-hydrate epimerase domain
MVHHSVNYLVIQVWKELLKLLKCLLEICDRKNNIIIFCGKGNNGGDGLAVCRMLMDGV